MARHARRGTCAASSSSASVRGTRWERVASKGLHQARCAHPPGGVRGVPTPSVRALQAGVYSCGGGRVTLVTRDGSTPPQVCKAARYVSRPRHMRRAARLARQGNSSESPDSRRTVPRAVQHGGQPILRVVWMAGDTLGQAVGGLATWARTACVIVRPRTDPLCGLVWRRKVQSSDTCRGGMHRWCVCTGGTAGEWCCALHPLSRHEPAPGKAGATCGSAWSA